MKQAARERTSERRSREGPRKERALLSLPRSAPRGAEERRELSFLSTDPRFCVSSCVPLARLLFTISPKRRACSQAKSKFKNISRGCWFYTRFDFSKVYFCDQPKPVELRERLELRFWPWLKGYITSNSWPYYSTGHPSTISSSTWQQRTSVT